MQQIVSITSQGQITIPASMRRLLALNQYKKALVKTEKKRIVVEPISDILSLAGVLKDKAIKGKNIDEIIKLEERATSESIAEKFHR